MKKRTYTVGLVFSGLVLIGLAVNFAVTYVVARGLRAERQAATLELMDWSRQHTTIGNDAELNRAIGVLEDAQALSVSSDAAADAPLQAQRKQAIDTIVVALQAYTKETFGADAAKWRAWQVARASKKAH